ncbi:MULTISPECIES: hypothetical protein [Shinella]|uniref:Adenylate cyclase MASE7 domain-containing protein n=1 Tax=Shinella sedimenti TaxID=2919913 RepID=A0ABT0CNP1_9HYPH|nr:MULTISPECIES: hypothetical protein [Shinella]MCJ8150231.1 hypothetical protein [Shinella sedimenti]
MSLLANPIETVRAYARHPDPRVAAANVIALVVASNQPFYPLYLFWLVSDDITAAWFTFLSTPFFLAVPAVSRWNDTAGRALLPLAGIGNTVLSAWLFGTASAVEVFLIPCGVISLLLFRPRERLVALAITALAFGVFLLLHDLYGPPLAHYDAAEYAALSRLNLISASTLTAFVALIFSGILAEAERSSNAAGDKKTG